MKILKYTLLNDQGDTTLDPPRGADPCSVAFQGERACLWVRAPSVDPPMNPRTFRLVYTGEIYDEQVYTYIGTAHSPDFVLHILEKIE